MLAAAKESGVQEMGNEVVQGIRSRLFSRPMRFV